MLKLHLIVFLLIPFTVLSDASLNKSAQYLTLPQLKRAIVKYNKTAPEGEKIINMRTYFKFRHNIKGAPSNPDKYYEDTGWIDWFDLLGKEKPVSKLETPQKLLKAIDIHNDNTEDPDKKIYSSSSYRRNRHYIDGSPTNPSKYYKDKGWTTWPDFLRKLNQKYLLPNMKKPEKNMKKSKADTKQSKANVNKAQKNVNDDHQPSREDVPFMSTLEELILAVVIDKETAPEEKWIIDEETYYLYYRRITGAPPLPDIYYEEWMSWEAFFAEVALAEKTSKEEFTQNVKKENAPKQRVRQAKGPMIPTPEKLLQVLARHNIKNPNNQITSPESYGENLDSIKGAPPNPYKYYGDAWPGTKVFFQQLKDRCGKVFNKSS